MKKIYIAIMIIAIVSMTLSACAPSFKNMRDADNYLSEQRIKADEDATYKVKDVTQVRGIKANTSVTGALRDALPSAVTKLDKTMEVLYALPATSKKMNFGLSSICIIEGTVEFNRWAAINRKNPPIEEWDLLSRAFLDTTTMPTCKVVKVKMKKVWGSSTVYKGTEGVIQVATGFRFDLYLGDPAPEETTCNREDAKLYVESVLKKVTEKVNGKAVITAQLK